MQNVLFLRHTLAPDFNWRIFAMVKCQSTSLSNIIEEVNMQT